jgi:hypothetical protein
MTRTAVHRSIEFQGLIKGCRDYQWLLTDALFEAASDSTEISPRWLIKSQDRSKSEGSRQVHYHFRDRHLNLQLSASSAPALAELIRARFHNHQSNQ